MTPRQIRLGGELGAAHAVHEAAGNDVIGVHVVPAVGIQVGEGLAEAILAAVTGLVLDVLWAHDHRVFRDGEVGSGSYNQLALDAELAVNGYIAGHSDGLALGDAGAVTQRNGSFAVPDDCGDLLQVAKGDAEIPLAV